jgi:hypothetical protein
MLPEWLDDIKKEYAEAQARLEASRGPGYAPAGIGEVAELLREMRDTT